MHHLIVFGSWFSVFQGIIYANISIKKNDDAGLNNQLAKFAALHQPQWIDVSKKLPDNMQPIIAYREADNWQVICDFFNNAFIIYDIEKDCQMEAYGITHWARLLSPPINTED